MKKNKSHQKYSAKKQTGLLAVLMALLALPVFAQEENPAPAAPVRKVMIRGNVYGGARMAAVKGTATVSLHGGSEDEGEGAATSDNIVIGGVYGGNDISNTVVGGATVTADGRDLFVAYLYGGGNGDYDYTSETLADGETPNPYYGLSRPDITTTSVTINGGTYGYVYGGGNSATVTESTVITANDETEHIDIDKFATESELLSMGIDTRYFNFTDFKVSRMFGGNNKVAMDIRPTWNLQKGSVNWLYSGGNLGDMTYENGLLLNIPKESEIVVENMFGGCRMANVKPGGDSWNFATYKANGDYTYSEDETDFTFPAGMSARVLVQGGQVTNIYGGNDVSGKVYGGNAVEIFHNVKGNVYGGGNGSYPYTDNIEVKKYCPPYADNYYEIPDGKTSIEALNDFRPNAEQVYIKLGGTEADNTVIGGSVFLGGNSATIKHSEEIADPMAKLELGSYVTVDQIFLGNNGLDMIRYNEAGADGSADTEESPNGTYGASPAAVAGSAFGNLGLYEGALRTLRRDDWEGSDKAADGKKRFCSLDLTTPETFAKYMNGAAMDIRPTVAFTEGYQDYTTSVGSFYCGGNVGSMIFEGMATLNFSEKMNIYSKVVGGCNSACVPETAYNAAYDGGIIGTSAEQADYTSDGKIKDRLTMNFGGVMLTPKKLNEEKTALAWHVEGTGDDARFVGGNVYGGCYASGCINGNVVINLNETTVDKGIFEQAGVNIDKQRDDALASALSVLGGGYGKDSEIWGNVTINLNKGYSFQIFGGGEMGAVGKKTGEDYVYDEAYGTVVNLRGKVAGSEVGDEGSNVNLAEAEYVYGGGYEGLVAGNTVVNLGNGRLYAAFGGACNADVMGHSETYIGRQPNSSGSGFEDGFPWLKDHVYGGNDLGGKIHSSKDFSGSVSADLPITPYRPTLTTASAYVEYVQGHVKNIFGGNYGGYDYHVKNADDDADEDGEFAAYHDNQPRLGHAFVNFKPNRNSENMTLRLYGGSEGMAVCNLHEKDQMQNSSYTLVDIKDEVGDRFRNLEVFGAGENAGLGMGVEKAVADANEDGVTAAAVIDLARGEIAAAYGGSFQEGITRRTLVNVPGPQDEKTGSTIKVGNLFAGSYGADNSSESGLKPCDVYEGTLNYGSETAVVTGSLFGGNNNNRRTLYGRVNVNSAVWTDREHTKLGKVFGAGKGGYTWSEYTEVNLNDGARVNEVYGGGELGCVVNKGTVEKLVGMFGVSSSLDSLTSKAYDNYGGLANDLAQERYNAKKFNTNVIINQGAVVEGYVYGGGLGDVEGHNSENGDTELGDANSGNVFGTTYVALLGGEVKKDIYGAGSVGSVINSHGVGVDDLGNPFIASSNVYIGGGTVRNVYGGGWEGAVGMHQGTTSSPIDTDVPGETNVWIGKTDGDTFTYSDGLPAIQRNVYGGGEGGAVCGTAHMTIKRGYIGYVYEDGEYKENIEDKTYMVNNVFQPNNRLKDAGNVFGGGYVNFGITDHTDVEMYDGVVRGSVFGGGEIAAVGRGMASAGDDGAYAADGTSGAYVQNHGMKIYNAGSTLVKIYGGEIHRNVFGGGRGFNNLGEIGTLNTDGYVFGNTEVRIRGGEIGTQEGLAEGYGNVFGGGDVGFVYSGTGWKKGESFSDEDLEDGVPSDGGGYYYKNGTIANGLSEDCKVVIEPYAKVEGSSVSINGNDYTAGDYVTLEDLSTLTRKNVADKAKWDQLAKTGVTIHNAVFAGGNVSVGSDMLSANTVTVYGNATAAVRDIYDFDLISIGAEHIGGIYGDGNMTLVDGWRELNISNYGTDFYNLSNSIDQTTYNTLTPRERAYYKLRYKCAQACTDINGDNHEVGETLMSDDILNLFEKGGAVVNADGTPNPAYWTPDGVSTIYEGRVLNTIQRADFVGIFGSRIVMQGARDRVPSKVDYTNYAVNRVGEVSLNQESAHGNYFGLYSVVNYLGNLTSDVKFTDTRTAADGSAYPADGTSYYNYKVANKNSSNRNNGISQNKVSMATGVFLEITREPARETDEETTKDWGYITGVVELGLVDGTVTGAGGGYVYAKNVHGTMTDHSGSWSKVTLSEFNASALTYRKFTYAAATASDDIETSGNFIHKDKTIVDDCFPMANSYVGSEASPAHYWYIKDNVYVYDEYISAYTGMAGSYLDKLNLPMPISKESHGTLTLVNVKPNRYAMRTVTVGNVTYQPGDPIDYWTWSQIGDATQQGKFAETVYAIVEDCTINGTKYDKGAVLTEAQKSALGTNPTVVVAGKPDATVNDVLRDANNLSHAGGFLLTSGFNNPEAWQITGLAPSFKATINGVLGQKDYSVGSIISQNNVDNYPSEAASLSGQAQNERAYVVTAETTVTNKDGAEQHLFPGTAVVASDYAAGTWSSMPVEAAAVVTSTLKLDDTRTLYPGELLSASEVTTLKTTYSSLNSQIDEVAQAAYYITMAGKYGGKYYNTTDKYTTLDSWCAVSESERANFTYDYDALDLLLDPAYSGSMALYDGTLDPKVYSVPQPIDYTARYTGEESLTFTDSNGAQKTLTSGNEIPRRDFEYVPNEQRHYTQIDFEAAGTYYYVKTPFTRGDVRYVAGMAMSAGDYNDLSDSQKANMMTLTVDGDQPGTYYFCRDDYTVGEHGEGVPVTDAFTSTEYSTDVPAGTIIAADTYGTLVNKQKDFEIYGTTPEQTSTLYVPNSADLYDLTKEKIITVVYQYDYEEKEGTKTTAQSERHVINIHINFKSGIPEIGELNAPKIVLPGTVIGMRTPSVTPGAYEVTSAGWEIFPNETDANNHQNGQPYHNNADKLYWYQDNYYVAYYAQTYLGKTYSNAVPFSVANYHDLKAVMDDKDHHYYIDHEDAFKERNPKIYINDYSGSEENGLDILKSLYNLSVGNTIDGHAALNERVKGCADLEIILRTNIDHSDASWTPIGDASQCFEGTLHGDGYTISGLDNSLFDHLCGSVYNLGVMGSFTSAGVANTGVGYVENCWVKTTGTPAGTKAVFGNPTGTSGYQVVNCYYPASNAYSATAHARGNATKMPDEAFYNGTVAYNLNGFYLYKRYNDGKNQATGLEYKYWKSGSDEPQTGHYAENARYCSTGYGDIKYVEERFADGDFIFADGTIPSETDSRWSETGKTYYPVWPDDYLFFGQMLTYGHDDLREHQDVPSHINRSEGRVLTSAEGNRVYRAPAYFRNSTMSMAHFNPYALFVQSKKGDAAVTAYKDMTAIDFTGGNGDVAGGYKLAFSDGKFYQPLLDDDGLTGFNNVDLTRNLLVYTGTESPASAQTNTVVSGYLNEPTYAETDDTYRSVATAAIAGIKGHQVVKSGAAYITEKDHLLVDRQDFNAPIAYKMGNGQRMWYQRIPDNYVNSKDGWEGISLPFAAELVTTNDKGEITHFYSGSAESKNATGTKIGHEYWLRGFVGISNDPSDVSVKIADMTYPNAGSDPAKTVANTFLWDYYYSANTQKDANADTYQTYYSTPRTYSNYARLANGKPYIIGFPGERYYEFDLSGRFVAQNTAATAPAVLGKQTITFASEPGYRVGVSDSENTGVTNGGYTFWPSYLKQSFDAGAAYVLNAEGGAYENVAGTTDAFRPYFTSSGGGARRMARSIVFSDEISEPQGAEKDLADDVASGVTIEAKSHKIIVTSALRSEADVLIVTSGGLRLKSFTVLPGETIETPVSISGVYIVQVAGGRYTKKMAVK